MRIRTELIAPFTAAALVMACGVFGPRAAASLDPDYISAVSNVMLLIVTVAGLFIAAGALGTWREELRGTSRHQAAREIDVAAEAYRYAFYAARSPMYWASEFPKRTREEAAAVQEGRDWQGYDHIYTNRRKEMWPEVEKLARLRATAAAVFGREVADAVDALARTAIELQNYQQEHVEHKRVGPDIVRQWPDQQWVQRVLDSVVTVTNQDPQDRFSREFEAKLATLKNLIADQ